MLNEPEQPIDRQPKPRNGESTKQFAIKAGIVGLFIIIVGGVALYGNALYTGRATFPESVSTALSAGAVAMIGIVVVWFQARTARIGREEAALRDALLREATAREAERSREEAVRQAELSRLRSDANAKETREKVQEGIDVMHNGLAAETAAIVKADSDKRAEDLRVALAADAARMEIATLSAKVDALMQMQAAAPVAPSLVLPNGQAVPDPALQTAVDAIEAHTKETAANTRDEPEGSAV